jgi:Tol biopolymer transport system component
MTNAIETPKGKPKKKFRWLMVTASVISLCIGICALATYITYVNGQPPALTIAPDCPPGTSPPASGRIAFTSARDGHAEIYSMNADGSGQLRLTHSPLASTNPSWSADGKTIFFFSESDPTDSNKGALFKMNADGSSQTRLIEIDRYYSYSISWALSPDGKQILFGRGGQIYLANIDGSNEIQISDGENDWNRNSPMWSPDGKKFAYFSYGLIVANADGSGRRQISSLSSRTTAFSPDGSHIAVYFENVGSEFNSHNFFVARSDGTELTKIYANGGGDPHWSPDGKRIAFIDNSLIRILNLDGSKGMTIGKEDYNIAGDLPPTPAWSPDGEWLAFNVLIPNSKFTDIALTKSTCSGLWKITSDAVDNYQPVWQP